jgi:PAS domain S-box-containing protein
VGPSDFRTLVENAPDAVVVSRNGIILYANAAAARILGYGDVSELLGVPLASFHDEPTARVMRQRIQQMMATGERLVPREYPARRKDGTGMTAEVASTVIDWEGAPAVLAYVRDVTERVRLRGLLAHADRLASLGAMAAGVAHEINNPLAFMRLATEMLERRAGAEDGALLAEVRAGIDRIAAIVRDLRAFGQSDDEAPGPMDLASAIDAAERLVQHELRPRGALVKEYGELPLVVGVPRRIEQVFVNVLLNAAYALGDRMDGRIVVRARVMDDCVAVSIEDDGCGIPAELLPSIFEPFVTTRAQAGGTGLGLSICRDIVARSGGELTATSTVGEGTTMTLTLPRALAGSVQERAPARPSPAAPRSTTRRSVLVVDDEQAIVSLLSQALASTANVTGVTDPSRALDLIRSGTTFDAIVCDVMMPGLTGIDLHERATAERPELAERFVFICGGTYTARARDHLERVANPRIQKPFRLDQVLEAIERVANLREGAALA